MTLQDFEAIASIATAIGVVFAAIGILSSWQQARTDFEDDLGREYRDLTKDIPAKAFLGEPLNEEEYKKAFPYLFRYIDLSNEQLFLRQRGRVCRRTWNYWREGIKWNLSLPAFSRAWDETKERADGSFRELRQLEASGFKKDPRQGLVHRLICRLNKWG